ncbi:MAG: HAMP domain-containing protein [Actinobacteria bacterium]|uniref:histidine kinase n=1 Tax=freshwater metagenome TaxID=449393 RepID=A0A6J6S8H7_9ZZZZ|nr:HAMP domain-containing protein [Actinomycetota bacterium]MSX86747.1 HAMP domain-containing protein [Actinomycetota bacterium]MSY70875.1 HAMP domain-containing protein [Actinomycetota bacterium]
MRRRLLLTICGTVLATLLFAGAGTLLLARFGATEATKRDLEEQATALASVFDELNILALRPGNTGPNSPTSPQQRAAVRTRLKNFTTNLKLDDIGFLYGTSFANLEGETPIGITLSKIDMASLEAGTRVSGKRNGIVYAAAPGTSRLGSYVIVLARKPASSAAPAARWFLLAAAGTLLAGALIATRLSRRLTNPLVDARDATSRIANGDLAARVDDPHPGATDEMSELSRSINAMAASLERSRGLERQFLMSVSHDLRTPMASIQGYAEALTDQAIEPQRAGQVILSESRRLDRLVTDLLLLARLDARAFTFDVRPLDLVPIVQASTHGFEPRAIERGLTLGVDTPPEPLLALVDGDRLAQILANLVENALKFAGSRVDVSLRADNGWVVLSVADDGPGIAPEDLPHVFERLYVARHRPLPKETGSGLGLAIVGELAETMGGQVHARSPVPETGRGTQMLVALRPA